MSGEGLRRALEKVLESLEAKDAVAAAAGVERICGELATQGPLDAAEVERARALLRRCEETALPLRETLGQALSRAAASRRATAAYGSAPTDEPGDRKSE